jgi:hypothetical protein
MNHSLLFHLLVLVVHMYALARFNAMHNSLCLSLSYVVVPFVTACKHLILELKPYYKACVWVGLLLDLHFIVLLQQKHTLWLLETAVACFIVAKKRRSNTIYCLGQVLVTWVHCRLIHQLSKLAL